MQVRFLELVSGKTPREQNSSGKKIGAESAVPILVYLYIVIMVHNYRQSAKKARNKNNKSSLPEVFPLTIGSGKTMPFEKRRSRYKETAENKAEAYLVYVEHLFSACDAVDARIFSKGGEMLRSYDANENIVSVTYDLLGRRIALESKDTGRKEWRYDHKGLLEAESDSLLRSK